MEPPFSEEEMKRNYPFFRAFVLSKMKEEFSQSLEPLVGGDLQKIAQEEGALPLGNRAWGIMTADSPFQVLWLQHVRDALKKMSQSLSGHGLD